MSKPSEQIMRGIRDSLTYWEISQRELAKGLEVSEARVSQMLAEGSNLTLGTVDKIYTAIYRIALRRPVKYQFLRDFFI